MSFGKRSGIETAPAATSATPVLSVPRRGGYWIALLAAVLVGLVAAIVMALIPALNPNGVDVSGVMSAMVGALPTMLIVFALALVIADAILGRVDAPSPVAYIAIAAGVGAALTLGLTMLVGNNLLIMLAMFVFPLLAGGWVLGLSRQEA